MNIWWVILLSGIVGTLFLMYNFKQKTVIEEEPNLNEEVDLKDEDNLGI